MNVDELETPSVLIDLDKMTHNIQAMQAHCNALGLAFRPHIKTHKSPAIAQMQLDAGAQGIACQKVSEAEIFAAAGITDIQIPYNIVGAKKTARLVDLALYNRVTVTVDHPSVISGIADAAAHYDMSIRVLVELETDAARTGAQTYEVVALAQRIEEEENLHFAGIMAYPSYAHNRKFIVEALEKLDAAGIGVDIVSGGGTGAALDASQIPELTELRVGTYVFNDWRSVTLGWTTLDQCAMAIATTVVSRPTPDRGIVDAGSKSLSNDRQGGAFGYVVEYPEATVYKLSEEHGFIDFSECDERPVIGERLHIIPVHVCVAMNLHDRAFGIRDGMVEVEWPIAARGRVW